METLSIDYWCESLTALVVFGSYARGEAGLGSDLDLLVIVKDSTRPFRIRSLAFGEYLEKHLRSPLRLEVSPFVFTEGELKGLHPPLLDVRRHHVLLYDEGFFKGLLREIDELYKKGAIKELVASGLSYWRIDYEKAGKGLFGEGGEASEGP